MQVKPDILQSCCPAALISVYFIHLLETEDFASDSEKEMTSE